MKSFIKFGSVNKISKLKYFSFDLAIFKMGIKIELFNCLRRIFWKVLTEGLQISCFVITVWQFM